jgi:hypothetical protein
MSMMLNELDELYVYEDIWGNQIPYYYIIEDIYQDIEEDDSDYYISQIDERIEEMISIWE